MSAKDLPSDSRFSQGHPRRYDRRTLLKAALGLAAGSGAGSFLTARAFAHSSETDGLLHAASAAVRAPTLGTPGLIVAGSPGTGPARWAPVLAPALEVTLPSDGPINLQNVAGQDGVTGANLFDAQASGENALLVPGTAILAALSGDSRVHFDYQRWLPVALIAGSPLVVGHVDFRRSLRTLLQNRPVRVAVTTPTGAELPTLLAMAILSMRAIPVRGLATPQTSIEALQRGEVDVVQLSPDNATPELLAALKDKGFVPLFSLTAEEGGSLPDFAARFTSVRGHAPDHALYPAYQATAHAASIEAALMLPMLTPPANAALWRHAAHLTAAQPAIDDVARKNHTHLITEANVFPFYAALTPPLAGILAFRRWLSASSVFWRTG
ncbi:MAG: hypothetical protein ABF876_01875 [Acetobacter aceti]|uniref:Uncharacterized protein n=1 Tax=Acetobacter aceti TaxID=435 RepID=A0A1U9KK30_ACEAC|nr:hypothetical protein [Acetobacter aceti]AQS86143.1 hypothetical protein A0U92_16825 [Acetobacter aceti]